MFSINSNKIECLHTIIQPLNCTGVGVRESHLFTTCLSICLSFFIYIYIYMYTHTCMYVYLCIYVYIYVYMYMYIYVCLHIYIYTYINICFFGVFLVSMEMLTSHYKYRPPPGTGLTRGSIKTPSSIAPFSLYINICIHIYIYVCVLCVCVCVTL